MTVCITGDVHHMSLGTRDQEYLDGRTEVDCALEYAHIAADYKIPVTLFVTGKAAVEERNKVRELGQMENVELGGHNYHAFDTPVHQAWRALNRVTNGYIGSWNGPQSFQSWEIRKTIKAFEVLGVEITSWRDHAYRHDGNTAELLAEYGISHFSDAVEPEGDVRRKDGLIIVPINTPPDHEHIYHAFRTPKFVMNSEEEFPFGCDSVEPMAWREWVLQKAEEQSEQGRTVTGLAHPACMWLADEFHTFESLCLNLQNSSHQTKRMQEVLL